MMSLFSFLGSLNPRVPILEICYLPAIFRKPVTKVTGFLLTLIRWSVQHLNVVLNPMLVVLDLNSWGFGMDCFGGQAVLLNIK